MTAATATGATLPALLLDWAGRAPTRPALRQKHRGVWHTTSWARYAARVAAVGGALVARGVQPGDRVAIASDNRVEWLVADLAVQGIGAASVGIYPTCPAAEVEYLLRHSGATVAVCEDEEQLDKVLEVWDRLPALRLVVIVDDRGVRGPDLDPRIVTFAALEAEAPAGAAEAFRRSVEALDPGACAVVVYTSGTTGPPKGAMLSHANLIAAGTAFAAAYDVGPADEVLSYLPLCHIAERLVSGIDALTVGYAVAFGEGGDSFPQDLREVQPTFFLGVPRVWEKLLAGTEIRIADSSRLKRAVYRWSLARGKATAERRQQGRATAVDRVVGAITWLVCFRQLRAKLGLARVKVALSGAAPIAPQVLAWCWAIGVEVREGYGQTEGTALATYTPAGDVRLGSVGVAVPGVEVRTDADGEILVRSPGVFLGYLDDPAATAATVDPDGWLRTGDVGTLDAEGRLTITDRKKDIIITAGGKNVSPSEIENRLKVSPYVREAIVIGDRRPYLTALIGIEEDTVGDWATRKGIAYTTYADLAGRDDVRALIAEAVEEANGDLAQVETIKRFALLTSELDIEGGDLTATMKVKRAAVERRFATTIDGLYASATAGVG